MVDTLRAARSRQLARLPEGQKPPAPRAALAMVRSKVYQAAIVAHASCDHQSGTPVRPQLNPLV